MGRYRTGKSFLLNRLIGQQAGFVVGPTVERCTRGIWVWGEPLRHVRPDGSEVTVLFLDTEGFGATEAVPDDDARVFSLATLLCSLLVYNSTGAIDEEAIQSLSFVANMTKHVQIKADGGGTEGHETGSEFHRFFPAFLWVVRDFSLELVDDDGDLILPREYLESCLAQRDGFSEEQLERNRVRQVLTSFFRKRDCATLCRPISDEAKLQELDQQPYESLKPAFREAMDELRQKVLDTLAPVKTLHGRPLNGRMLAGLVRSYIDALNKDAVPSIGSAWQAVSSAECRSAAKGAVDAYHAAMQATLADLPREHDDLVAAHDAAAAAAAAHYGAHAVGEQEHVAEFKAEVDVAVSVALADAVAANAAASRSSCRELADALRAEIIDPKTAPDGEGYSDHSSFAEDLSRLRDRYLEGAHGPSKYEALCSALLAVAPVALRSVTARDASERAELEAAHAEALAALTEELEALRGKEEATARALEQSEQRSSELEAKVGELEPALAVAREDAARIAEEKAASQALAADKEAEAAEASALANEAAARADAADERVAAAESRMATLREQLAEAERATGAETAEKERLERVLEAKEGELAEARARIAELEEVLREKEAEVERLNESAAELRKAKNKLIAEGERAAKETSASEAAHEEVKRRLDKVMVELGTARGERDSAAAELQRTQDALEDAEHRCDQISGDLDEVRAAAQRDVSKAEASAVVEREELQSQVARLEDTLAEVNAQLRDTAEQAERNAAAAAAAAAAADAVGADAVAVTVRAPSGGDGAGATDDEADVDGGSDGRAGSDVADDDDGDDDDDAASEHKADAHAAAPAAVVDERKVRKLEHKLEKVEAKYAAAMEAAEEFSGKAEKLEAKNRRLKEQVEELTVERDEARANQGGGGCCVVQ